MNLILSEAPHFVIQGEGNLVGKKMYLFRVSKCNIGCIDCDSKFTFTTKHSEYTVEQFSKEIQSKIDYYDFVMVTGGAPSLYKDFLYEVVKENDWICFQIEDAGDADWSDFNKFSNVYFSFSPKIAALQSATNIKDWNAFINPPKNYICKIVVDKNDWENNIEYVKSFQQKYNIEDNKIYLMPKGVEREEIIEQSQFLIDKCFEYGYNFSTRLHILLYGNKRGV